MTLARSRRAEISAPEVWSEHDFENIVPEFGSEIWFTFRNAWLPVRRIWTISSATKFRLPVVSTNWAIAVQPLQQASMLVPVILRL